MYIFLCKHHRGRKYFSLILSTIEISNTSIEKKTVNSIVNVGHLIDSYVYIVTCNNRL